MQGTLDLIIFKYIIYVRGLETRGGRYINLLFNQRVGIAKGHRDESSL